MATITIAQMPPTPAVEKTDILHTSKAGVDYRATIEEAKVALSKLSHTESINAVDAETVTVTKQLTIINVDTSLGNATVTVANGLFDGQQYELHCNGIGLLYGKGTGFYLGVSSLGIPVSDGLVLRGTWSDSQGKWKNVNEITASYSNGIDLLKQSASGFMEIISTAAAAVSTTQASGGVFIAPSSYTVTYTIPFGTVPSVSAGNISSLVTGWVGRLLPSTTQCFCRAIGTSSASTVQFQVNSKGVF